MAFVSVEDYDPNIHLESNVWAVYDGRFKTYRNRGPALNKVMYSHSAKLFESVNGTWVERAYKPRSHLSFCKRPCDICGGRPLHATVARNKYGPPTPPYVPSDYAHGYWVWERQGSRVANPPKLLFVCYPCKQNIG